MPGEPLQFRDDQAGAGQPAALQALAELRAVVSVAGLNLDVFGRDNPSVLRIERQAVSEAARPPPGPHRQGLSLVSYSWLAGAHRSLWVATPPHNRRGQHFMERQGNWDSSSTMSTRTRLSHVKPSIPLRAGEGRFRTQELREKRRQMRERRAK